MTVQLYEKLCTSVALPLGRLLSWIWVMNTSVSHFRWPFSSGSYGTIYWYEPILSALSVYRIYILRARGCSSQRKALWSDKTLLVDALKMPGTSTSMVWWAMSVHKHGDITFVSTLYSVAPKISLKLFQAQETGIRYTTNSMLHVEWKTTIFYANVNIILRQNRTFYVSRFFALDVPGGASLARVLCMIKQSVWMRNENLCNITSIEYIMLIE